MLSVDVVAIALEAIPSLFILFSLWLHRRKIFKKTIDVSARVSHLMKQKELFEFGIVQMGVGAAISYLDGFSVTVFCLVLLVLVWVTVPYLVMTLFQGNRLGWVKSNSLCVIYVVMILEISIGARFLEGVLTRAPGYITAAVIVGLAISLGEFIRS